MTINDIKRKNTENGNFFFERSTMRFFDSRVCRKVWPTLDGGAFFVTSEQYHGSNGFCEPRKYTVRIMRPDGDCETAETDGFQLHRSLRAAKRQAALFARERNGNESLGSPCHNPIVTS